MSEAKATLPSRPRQDEDDARWCAWLSRALGCDEMPIVGARAYGSDDVEETAIIITLADRQELMFRPARVVVSRRLLDVFAARGCEIPNYTAQQIRTIGSALGWLARNSRARADRARSETEFTTLGAEWIQRCLLRSPTILLTGREGERVRMVIERVRATVAQGGEATIPPLVYDAGADQLLIWTSPFRRYVRERRGTTSDELLGVQMQRVGWERGNLAARPKPPRKGTIELAAWMVPNGWQGITVESSMVAGENAEPTNSRSATFDSPTRARARTRMFLSNADEHPNENRR